MASNKITTNDKIGLVEKKVHINQYWDDDYNEQKLKHNLNDDRITVNESDIIDLSNAQTGGLKSFTTYVLLQAYATPNINDSYKVTNDSDSALNGYYHWVSGTNYVLDEQTVNSGTFDDTDNIVAATQKSTADYFNNPQGEVAEGETLAVSGDKIYNLDQQNIFNDEEKEVNGLGGYLTTNPLKVK